MSKKWTKTSQGNSVLDGDGFFVSYNPSPGMGLSMFKGDGGSDETALVRPDDEKNKYRILNGDFRQEYEDLVDKGFNACLAIFEQNKECESSWST